MIFYSDSKFRAVSGYMLLLSFMKDVHTALSGTKCDIVSQGNSKIFLFV